MSTSFSFLFLALPAPLKIILIIVGGFSLVGVAHRGVVAEPAVLLPAQAPLQQKAKHQHRAVEAAPRQAVVVRPLVVIVSPDGSYRFADKKHTGPELVKELKRVAVASPLRAVEIRADVKTPHQMVSSAMKLVRSAGLTNLSFVSK